jgi:hypothetical protein
MRILSLEAASLGRQSGHPPQPSHLAARAVDELLLRERAQRAGRQEVRTLGRAWPRGASVIKCWYSPERAQRYIRS